MKVNTMRTIDTISGHAIAKPRPRPKTTFFPFFTLVWTSAYARLAAILTEWAQRGASRRALRDLDEHMLRDIGITAQEAKREASVPFWRIVA